MFSIESKDKNSRARTGFLKTPSGHSAKTPAYVIVGTHAEVRTLLPEDITKTQTQMIISNTYHLWKTLGKEIHSFEGLNARLSWNGITMTDSGGFQVFSLGIAREHGASKTGKNQTHPKKNLVKITPWGAFFQDEGFWGFLTPKKSIRLQEKIGADIVLAFDECTSPFHNEAYNARALHRTHRWAEKCIREKKNKNQLLYGIVQGGGFKKLREESARFTASLPFDGFAIGGSFSNSFGDSRKAMEDVLDWTIPYLPDEKPRHLLGIGSIRDIFLGVEKGIDTFDCVIPTREGRHGSVWTESGRINLLSGSTRNDTRIIEEECDCEACIKKIRRNELGNLFREKNQEAGRLATIHNVRFFNRLMETIRDEIKQGTFGKFKKKILSKMG